MTPEAQVSSAPPTQPRMEATLKALETLHEIVTGYRELSYKIVIANTTLFAAICYAIPRDASCATRTVAGAAVLFLGLINMWWLNCLRGSADGHVELARKLWKKSEIEWNPTPIDQCWCRRAWTPLMSFVGMSSLLAIVWIFMCAQGACRCIAT